MQAPQRVHSSSSIVWTAFTSPAMQSVGQALLIMVNVPLALIGGVLGLMLMGEYLSVPAAVGFIALLGIARVE